VLLKRENGLVSRYLLLGGDFFDRENTFIEQMTTWRKDSSSKSEIYNPRRHREARQVWREFSSLLAETSDTHRRPGVVTWMATLRAAGLIKEKVFKVRIAGIQFADKDFYVDGIISDSLAMSLGLLTELGRGWIEEIGKLLEVTDNCVRQLGFLALDIAVALGNSDENNRRGVRDTIQERAYFELDIPFREWLVQLDPEIDDHTDKHEEWIIEMRKIIEGIAVGIIEEAGEKAIIGIYKVGDSTSTVENAPRAYRKFRNKINQLCSFSEGGTK